MIYDVSGSSDNLKQFKELAARVESKIEEKSGKKKEQKVKPMHSMSLIEFAEDNRRIKARLKFAFDDEMSKGVQVLSSGIYIELFDIKTNKAVPDCIDQLHVLYGNTYKQKEFHKEIAGLQALNVSTNVYRGRKPNQFCQNYQYSDIQPNRLWARILEYRVTWNNKNMKDTPKLELIGFKIVIFKDKYTEKTNQFYPLYMDN